MRTCVVFESGYSSCSLIRNSCTYLSIVSLVVNLRDWVWDNWVHRFQIPNVSSSSGSCCSSCRIGSDGSTFRSGSVLGPISKGGPVLAILGTFSRDRKKRSFGKGVGSFRKCPVSREFRDSRDSRDLPQSVEKTKEYPTLFQNLEILENLERLWRFRRFLPRKDAFPNAFPIQRNLPRALPIPLPLAEGRCTCKTLGRSPHKTSS